MNLKPPPLRLFAIRSMSTGKILPDLFFSDKPAAKRKRDELGAAVYRVVCGPDHRRYQA